MKKMTGGKLIRRLFGVLLALLMAAVFYVAIILGQPQDDMSTEVDMHQPLVSASPAMQATNDAAASVLMQDFPVPALCAAPGANWTVSNALSYDIAFEDGLARLLSIDYQLSDGTAVQVASIYPARALSLIPGDGYRLTGAGPALAGNPSVRMEKGGSIRLHAQSTNCIYVVTAAFMDDAALSELVRPLTLIGGT